MLILSRSVTTTSQGISFCFRKDKNKITHARPHTPSACSKTLSSAQRATSRLTTATSSPSAETDHLSITDSPAKRSSALKDIIPVPPAHSHQGLCRRLGRTKGNLGWNVPAIPKGTPFHLVTGHHLQHELHQADISESSILITEPYFNLPQIQCIYDQFVFEEYEFQSYYRCTRPCILHSKKSPRIHLSLNSRITHPPWFIVHRTTQNPRR